MIISKKRFEKEVRKEARRMYRETCQDKSLELIGDEIERLRKRIARLEKKQQKGSINGYYVSPTETVIVKKEEEGNEDA